MITALVGGRPGMISAATAAVAVLVVPLVRDHGLEYLFAATILMGMLQVVAGLLRLNLLMQYVSRSVITGFVNALAILIFMAQLPQLIDVTPVTYAHGRGGLAIIYLFPRLTRAVPSPLVAIVVLTVAHDLRRARRQHGRRHGRAAVGAAVVPDPERPVHLRDAADHPALFADHGRRRACWNR